jgi:hypothetical protein
MAKMLKVTGVKNVIAGLRTGTARFDEGLKRGLWAAGLFLHRESVKIVPVQTGNLKNSGFVFSVGKGHVVAVGYSADYAAYVHENLEAAHGAEYNIKHADEISRAKADKRSTAESGNFNRGENQQAKFLENPAKENRDEILRLIANGVK